MSRSLCLARNEDDSSIFPPKFNSFLFASGKRNVAGEEGLPTTEGPKIEALSLSARVYARILSIGGKARLRVKGIRPYITSLFAKRKDSIPENHLDTSTADEYIKNESDYKDPGLERMTMVDTKPIRKERISHFEGAPTNPGERNFKGDGH